MINTPASWCSQLLQDAFLYDPINRNFTILPTNPAAPPLGARLGASVVSVASQGSFSVIHSIFLCDVDALVVFGGSSLLGALNDVKVYFPSPQEWLLLEAFDVPSPAGWMAN